MIDNIQGNPLDNNPPESRHQPPNYMSPATRPPGPPMAPGNENENYSPI